MIADRKGTDGVRFDSDVAMDEGRSLELSGAGRALQIRASVEALFSQTSARAARITSRVGTPLLCARSSSNVPVSSSTRLIADS